VSVPSCPFMSFLSLSLFLSSESPVPGPRSPAAKSLSRKIMHVTARTPSSSSSMSAPPPKKTRLLPPLASPALLEDGGASVVQKSVTFYSSSEPAGLPPDSPHLSEAVRRSRSLEAPPQRMYSTDEDPEDGLSPAPLPRCAVPSVSTIWVDENDLNPLKPCGACSEWLKKIAGANPMLKVITFTDANCSGIYIERVHDD